MAKRSYTIEEKASAIALLEANGGNLSKTAKQLGIPRTSLIAWRDGEGVGASVEEIRQSQKREFTELVVKKEREILDILREEIYAAAETLPHKRHEADYADVVRAIAIFIDKMQLLTGGATSRHELTWSEVVLQARQGLTSGEGDNDDPFA